MFNYVLTVLVLAMVSPQISLCDEDTSDETDMATGAQLTMVEEPQSITLAPGVVAELRCEVFGTPVPTVTWLHNGNVIRMGEKPNPFALPHENGSPVMAERMSNQGMRTFQMATTSSKVRIPCADASRAGLYTCAASNGRETITANATVRVEEKSHGLSVRCPRKRSQRALVGSPAEIYMWTESRMERPGVSVQLMCRASGYPKPKINWYETSADLDEVQTRTLIQPDDKRFMLLPNGDLLVKKTPIKKTPMNIYQCEAVNEFGKNEVSIMLLQILDDTKAEDQQEGELGSADVPEEQESFDGAERAPFPLMSSKN